MTWCHLGGDKRAWWKTRKIDPISVARKLWDEQREGKGEKLADASAGILSAQAQAQPQSG